MIFSARRSAADGTGKRPSALIALAGFSAFTASPAAAQFSVTPVILEVEAAEAPVGSLVRVRNEGADELAMRVYTRDFEQDSLGEHHVVLPGSHPNGCGDRIRFVPAAFSLPPGEDQTVSIQLLPGGGAESCWSLVFIDAPPPAGRQGIRVGTRIGVKVFGLARGGSRAATVEAAAVEQTAGRRLLRMSLANRGAWPILARGNVEIMDFQGETVARTRIERTTVLPSHVRVIEVPLEAELAAGRYLAVSLFDLGEDELIGAQVAFRVEQG